MGEAWQNLAASVSKCLKISKEGKFIFRREIYSPCILETKYILEINEENLIMIMNKVIALFKT